MTSPRREAKRERSKAAELARIEAAKRRKKLRTIAVLAVLAVILSAAGIIANVAGGDDKKDETASSSSSDANKRPSRAVTGDTPCPAVEGESFRATGFEKAPPMCIDPAKKYTATFDTSEGKVVVDLDTTKTPN